MGGPRGGRRGCGRGWSLTSLSLGAITTGRCGCGRGRGCGSGCRCCCCGGGGSCNIRSLPPRHFDENIFDKTFANTSGGDGKHLIKLG